MTPDRRAHDGEEPAASDEEAAASGDEPAASDEEPAASGEALGLAAVARPHLDRLARELGAPVSAAVLDGGHVVRIARSGVDLAAPTADDIPPRAGALGRVLLSLRPEDEWEPADAAALRETRLRGWAEGARSIAVPVRGVYGLPAALEVAAPEHATRLETAAVVERLMTVARTIDDELRASALERGGR
ncbi:hypothetical protein [Demequina rhizosphaerae]|uniref:hypothetical protein n=1 Tax=Demequina rhizosphaerae TaxID=1638985 RepID=UPI0007819F10|nr:hypothetical protein [Demequina rhizosphaerae]